MQSFFVNVSQTALDDLKARLAQTRWPAAIEDSGWSRGADLSYIKDIVQYWQHSFDWRKKEASINAYPNYIIKLSAIDIHFLHVKGKGKRSIPLLITHGWPGSFLEMMKLIPLLTAPGELSFDLVIPSVPGFGFSGKPTAPGCNSSFVAGLWHQLMTALGYDRYGVQGGDIGSAISTWLCLTHPGNIIGLHLNYISGSFQPHIPEGILLPAEVTAFQKIAAAWFAKEGAYAALQATKPMTVAYGLNDSPVGLCAWIIEKFNAWSDTNGNIENIFTKDELLANVTLYWLTQTIGSSLQIYYENREQPLVFNKDQFVQVPVAFASFPKEIPTPPRWYIEKGYNIQRWTSMPAGGHFAAAEQPALLAADIQHFFWGIF